jgi:hypothetical protein
MLWSPCWPLVARHHGWPQHPTETLHLSAAQEPFLTNLMTFVPQTVQIPLMAGRPFLSTTSWVSFINRFALHFTQ